MPPTTLKTASDFICMKAKMLTTLPLRSGFNITLTAVTSIVSWITSAGAKLCASSSPRTVVETDSSWEVNSQQVLHVLL